MKVRMLIAGLSALMVIGGNAWAAPFSALYTFGDSLSDAGDSPFAVMSLNNTLGGICDPTHPCPPYDGGRISNGPVASERLAVALFGDGNVTTSNFRSYAVAGATTGIGNAGDGGSVTSSGTFGLPGMRNELNSYLGHLNGGQADPNALYMVWGGANDFLATDSPITSARNVAGYVNELAAAGARHFLVPNLGDLGATPLSIENGPAFQASATNFSVTFNSELNAQLNNLDAQFPSADIFRFDTFSFVNGVIADPAGHPDAEGNRLTDVTHSCLGSLDCFNPIPIFGHDHSNEYLFWDDLHPTTQAHLLLAGAFAAAVPEPEIYAMFAAGLFVLGAANARRRRLENKNARLNIA
jgi:phospholipase/lecithinase/hemolysin